jgi:hypothetical protein
MSTTVRSWAIRMAVVLTVAGGFALLAVRLNHESLGSDAVVPIAWDEQACADCHMHIGDPHFAAQIITDRGDALSFDDPGCLLRYLARERPHTRAVYFHHMRDDRWLRAPAVGFVEVPRSPMGYGLAAVEPSEPTAIGYTQAQARLLTLQAHASGGAP